MMDHVHAQSPGTLQVQRPVIDKDALGRRTLRNFQGHPENRLVRLPGSHIAGAEKRHKITPQVECFDSILIQLQRLVVDRTDQILPRLSRLIQYSPHIRILLRLRKHKPDEFLASELPWPIEERPVKIFVQCDVARIERRKGKIMAVLKLFPVEMKLRRRFPARMAVPSIGQYDSADVPEQRCNFRQVCDSSSRTFQGCVFVSQGRADRPHRRPHGCC